MILYKVISNKFLLETTEEFVIFQAGLEMGCTRCNFEVLDWNAPSIDFYKSQGAIDRTGTEGWLSFRMNHQEMKKFCSSDSL